MTNSIHLYSEFICINIILYNIQMDISGMIVGICTLHIVVGKKTYSER